MPAESAMGDEDFAALQQVWFRRLTTCGAVTAAGFTALLAGLWAWLHVPVLLIGAAPNTKWLAGSGVATDAKGFVLTGTDAGKDVRPLETSRPGIYAIGDVRLNSVKRVAAAVGEGAQVVAALHAYLATQH